MQSQNRECYGNFYTGVVMEGFSEQVKCKFRLDELGLVSKEWGAVGWGRVPSRGTSSQ